MMKRLLSLGMSLLGIGVIYGWMCLVCISGESYVSPEDYARMSQEIVQQSIQDVSNE